MFTRLGAVVYRRRVWFMVGWGLLFVLGILFGRQIFDRVTTAFGPADAAESIRAQERLEDLGTFNPDVIALLDGTPVDDPALKREVTATAQELRETRGVKTVVDFYSTSLPELVAEDGRATLVAVDLQEGTEDEERQRLETVVEKLEEIEAAEVTIGGDLLVDEDFREQSEKDLKKAELISMPVVLVIMLIVFGGIVAAGLPLVVALSGIAGTLLLLFLISLVTEVSVFAINVATMLGLGLAVDYALLVVNRFREERARGREIRDAIERTVATAGMTVAFSGLTVAVCLAGLFFLAEPFFWSLAFGGIGVVLLAMLAAITLLPALIAVAGKRIKPAKQARSGHGFFFRLSHFVMRRALLIVIPVALVLLLLGTPFLRAEFFLPGAEILPESSGSRQVFEQREARFPGGGTDPIDVVAEAPPDSRKLAAFAEEVAALEGVEAVNPIPAPSGEATLLTVVPKGPSHGETAIDLVQSIRDRAAPFDFLVGGSTAQLVDWKASLQDRLPFALGFLALATFFLLFMMTGSLVVPAKAIAMNILSLGASFGALVWVFQDGNLSGLLDFESAGALDLNLPVLIFVFAFGLSMDYEVFLLSRIKEVYEESKDNDQAVAVGLQRTGSIVTSAAILIVVVFLGFVAGEMLPIKMMGLGLSLAVILDATVVRSLLVPSTMKLMGDRNWWAPAPLKRFHDRFGLHEPPSEPALQEVPAQTPAGPRTTLTPVLPVVDAAGTIEWADRAYEIRIPESQIGRNPQECEILLDDPYASWMHAEIVVQHGRVLLSDLGSRNGTLVNGQPFTSPRVLQDRDEINVGETTLVFRAPVTGAAAAPPREARAIAEAPAAAIGAPPVGVAAVPADGTGSSSVAVAPSHEPGTRSSAVAPDAFFLLCTRGRLEGRSFRLQGSRLVIGREAADVELPDPTVSRNHAVLTWTGAGWSIADSESSWGTVVDDRKLAPGEAHVLEVGDEIVLGEVTVRFVRTDPLPSG